ncbi:MAG TPA: glutamyl-tRNA reductase [Micromonosporaceae bacterium]|jgi:glutamyl-tRNA reductase
MTGLTCVSIGGCQVSLELLEALSYGHGELPERLPVLRASSGATGVVVLSTCQRTEVYATWSGDPDDNALIAAIECDRGVPGGAVQAVARAFHDDAAVRHLLRVASGLESFVLGEAEIAGQVRAAAEASRAVGVHDVVLERLMDTAISASRKTRRGTSIAAATRSIASVAVETVVRSSGGTVEGQRFLVVGAGQVAEVVVDRAMALGAAVTVCNRTRRHAARFAAAGARVVDLADLSQCLGSCDVAILATAAPHPLVDAATLLAARSAAAGPLTLADLSLPRNVDSDVRALPSVRLIDLADLREAGTDAGDVDLAGDVAATEGVIEVELRRFLRWLAGQSVAASLRQVRRDAEHIARQELARATAAVPCDVHEAMERAVLRTVHRLVHGPTRQLLTAAEAGDTRLVNLLGSLFADAGSDSASGQPDAAAAFGRPLFDVQRPQMRTADKSAHERDVHAADEVAV